MANATAYKRAKLAEQWDAIVIGSGMGGLAAAVLLGQHGGKRVLVLERHYEAGGFTHTFHRPGYEWDVGLHYIGQMHEDSTERRAFDHITGGRVRWQPMPAVYDRIFIDGRKFEFAAGLEMFREGLKQAFPGEARAVDHYIAEVHACNRAMSLYNAEKAIPAPLAKLAGGLMRASYLRWARRTTLQVLESLTANRELIGVLTAQWGDYGLPPAQSSFAIHAIVAEHYFGGGSYPVGGAGVIAAAAISEIERHDGSVASSAEVAGILVEGGRAAGVRMADGKEFRSKLVISDAGAANTFERLLPADLAAVDPLRARLRRLASSTGHCSLYLGLSESDAALNFSGTNLWVYPSYDHDANVERFAKDIDVPFPVVYISFPSSKDPTFAQRYPGRSTMEAITMLPYALFERWGETRWKRRDQDYDELKKTLAARLRAEVERQVPAAAGRIDYAELSTPLTTRHFANYSRGEIYGIAATPERYLTRELGARTPIRGLYLTGQDACELGIMGALFGGVISASVALGKNLFSAVSKSRSPNVR